MKLMLLIGALFLPLSLASNQDVSRRSPSLIHDDLGKRAVKTCNTWADCPTPENGSPECVKKKCTITCSAGYFKSGSTCVRKCGRHSDCPLVANAKPLCGKSGACYFRCNSPRYEKKGTACVETCSKAKTCKVPINSTAVCRSGFCDFQCKRGFRKSASQCLQICKATSKCKTVPHASKPVCKSGLCAFTCRTGFVLDFGRCVVKPECLALRDCNDGPANGKNGGCVNGKCAYSCYPGYELVDRNRCIVSKKGVNGIIRIADRLTATPLGFLAPALNDQALFGTIVNSSQDAQVFKLTRTSVPDGFYALKLLPPASSYPSYEYAGFATGLNSESGFLEPGRSTYAALTPSAFTAAAAQPGAVGSAYLDKTGLANKVETSLWFQNSAKGQLTAQWTNPDGGWNLVYVSFFLLDEALVITGDDQSFSTAYPDAIPVNLAFVRV